MAWPRLDIRADERGIAIRAAVTVAGAGAAGAMVASAADALFLGRVGAAHLGAMLAVSSAALVAVLGGVGALADRASAAGRARLPALLCVLAAVVVTGLGALVSMAPAAASAALVIAGKQVSAAVELAFWVLCAERMDARQARRLVPLLMAANGLGVAAGALAVAPVAGAVGVPGAVVCGAALFLVTALPAAALGRTPVSRPLASGAPAMPRASMLAVVRSSPLAVHLGWVVAAAGAFAPMVLVLLGGRAQVAYPAEAELAAFLGQLRGVVQVAALAAQLVAAPLILGRAGVAPALLVAPVVAVISAVGLGASNALAVAVAAQAAARVVDAIQTPAEKLVQNLLVPEVRGRVAGFLDGVAKRAGAIAGGLAAASWPLWHGAPVVALAAFAVAWLVFAVRLRQRFGELAVAELALPDRLELPEMQALSDERTVARLRRELGDGPRQALAIELMVQLGEHGRVDAAVELGRAAATAQARQALLAALCEYLDAGRARVDAHALARALGPMFADASEGDVVLGVRALGLAARHARGRDHTAAAALGRVIEHSVAIASVARDRAAVAAPAGALAATIALARARGGHAVEIAEDALDEHGAVPDPDGPDLGAVALSELAIEIVHAGDTEREALPERAWRLLRAARRRARVMPDAVSARAVRALGVMLAPGVSDSAEDLFFRAEVRDLAVQWAGHGAAELRAAGMALIGRAADPHDAPLLGAALGDADERVRREAARGLAALGPLALDALVAASRFGRRRARATALALLGDLRLDADALDRAMDCELGDIDRTVMRAAALGRLPGGAMAVRRLGERIDEITHTVFLLIEARLAAPAVVVIARQYLRVPTRFDDDEVTARARVAMRARALEALDALLPRQRAGRVLAVLEDAPIEVRCAAAAERLGIAAEVGLDTDEAVRAELGGSDPLARDLVVHALGKDGRASHRDAILRAAAAAVRAADPLDMLRRITGAPEQSGEEDDMPRSVETVMTLSQVPLFAELSTRQLGELAEVVRWHVAAPGDVIVREGEAGSAMYFVASGGVRVEVAGAGGARRVGELGPGEPFGEMALFEDAPRSATVIAEQRSRIGRIERADFEALVDDMPGIALAICRVLGRRVRGLSRQSSGA